MSVFRKFFVTVTVSAVAVFAAAGCADTETASTSPVTQTTGDDPMADLTPAEKDELFLKVVGEHGMHGQPAIDAAKAMCDALDRGNSAEQVALIALDGLDGDIDKAGTLLGAGAATYCPEYADALANVGGSAA